MAIVLCVTMVVQWWLSALSLYGTDLVVHQYSFSPCGHYITALLHFSPLPGLWKNCLWLFPWTDQSVYPQSENGVWNGGQKEAADAWSGQALAGYLSRMVSMEKGTSACIRTMSANSILVTCHAQYQKLRWAEITITRYYRGFVVRANGSSKIRYGQTNLV